MVKAKADGVDIVIDIILTFYQDIFVEELSTSAACPPPASC